MPPSTRPSILQITFHSLLEVRTPIAFSYLGKITANSSVCGCSTHQTLLFVMRQNPFSKKTVVSRKKRFSTQHMRFATFCDKQKDCSSPPKGVSVSHPQRGASHVFIHLAPRLLIVCPKVFLSQKSQQGFTPNLCT